MQALERLTTRSTAIRASSATRRWWCRSTSCSRQSVSRSSTPSSRPMIRVLPRRPPAGPARPARAVPPGRHGAQGRRGRQRRHPRLDPADGGVDGADPLFLQAKEAQASVLEQVAGRSTSGNHGQRVVLGQRLMQAASDIFLGWQTSTGPTGCRGTSTCASSGTGRCPWTWSGWSRRAVASTPGSAGGRWRGRMPGRATGSPSPPTWARSDTFEHAVADFATAYADQNARDFEDLTDAIRTGRVTARTGV